MSETGDNDDDDFPPALEDAEIDDADLDDDDVSSDASVVTDSSESISVDSDTLEAAGMDHPASSAAFSGEGDVVIHRFNKLMDQGIEEGDEDAETSDDDDDDDPQETEELTGDHKRRRGVVENGHESFSVTLGEPIIVPLKSESDDEDADFSRDSPAKGHGRRVGRSRDEALERNMIRRQSSNEMLQAMQNATKSDSVDTGTSTDNCAMKIVQPTRKPPPRTKSGEGFQRRPPARTKSGEGPSMDGFQRRPPPRTKSGEGEDMSGFERRAPPRTKSGEILQENGCKEPDAIQPMSRLQRARDQRLTVAAAPPNGETNGEHSTDQNQTDALILSPSGRRRRGIDKEMALKRNAARRQKSSDMLGAMRDATRQAPGRSKSSAATFQRRPPARSHSGAGASSGCDVGIEATVPSLGDGTPIRRPPPRTKSSDGRQSGSVRAPPTRRAPDRTKSGSILQPTKEEEEGL
jgi:hypothetical protein